VDHYKEIITAMAAVLDDKPPGKIDALLFHGRPLGDEGNLITTAARLVLSNLVDTIIVSDSRIMNKSRDDEKLTWHGQILKEELEKLQIASTRIVLTNICRNTKIEGREFVGVCKTNNFRSAAVFAHPHQLLRCWLSTFKAMDELSYHFDLYAISPAHTDWHESARGAQAIPRAHRYEEIGEEIKKLFIYPYRGDIATPTDYLRDRQRRKTRSL